MGCIYSSTTDAGSWRASWLATAGLIAPTSPSLPLTIGKATPSRLIGSSGASTLLARAAGLLYALVRRLIELLTGVAFGPLEGVLLQRQRHLLRQPVVPADKAAKPGCGSMALLVTIPSTGWRADAIQLLSGVAS